MASTSAKVRFPSSEWAAALRVAINASESYRAVARGWEGEFLLLVTPDERAPKGEGVRLELSEGLCQSAAYVPDAATVPAEIVYRGSRENWHRLLAGELDPLKSLYSGAFGLGGNIAKAMRFPRAAKELLDAAQRIPRAA